MVHIQHALYQAEKKDPATGKYPLKLGSTKTQQGDRCLSLPADFCAEIARYRKVQLEQRLKTPDWQDTGFVFTRLNGQPISPASFSRYYRYTRHRLGIATTFHMLRHDMASRMKSANIFDLKDIQSQLGHSSIKITTDIYTHMDLVAKTKVSNWLEGGVNDLLSSQPVKSHKIP
ncbi:site-specific integrase [Selenomonas ruminantium]|uniref:Phage integrase family protein n=1 Tax=Selenomonas ruminantium TaxID=971 RepID=A0A1H0QMK9_SELRU|nr:site-specific integrase [Selenomonas ruminantium]SDP18315.1 Phage integrase family protein [Selenomonas ruminantium]